MEYMSSSKQEAIHTKGYLHELCHTVADWFSKLINGRSNENAEKYESPPIIYWNTSPIWTLSPYHFEADLFGISPNQSGDYDGAEEG
ncbi:MAG: hypothetical protein WC613_05425 [Candidatus Aenigmatarchaeota archaeon]